jgi:hypothetical protein
MADGDDKETPDDAYERFGEIDGKVGVGKNKGSGRSCE